MKPKQFVPYLAIIYCLCWISSANIPPEITRLLTQWTKNVDKNFDKVHVEETIDIYDVETRSDFYSPNSFNVESGNTFDVGIKLIFEENVGQCLPIIGKLTDMKMTKFNGHEILSWASETNLYLQWTKISTKNKALMHSDIPGILSINHAVVQNPITKEDGLFLILLTRHSDDSRRVLFLEFDLKIYTLVPNAEFEVNNTISYMHYTKIPNTEMHILFPGKFKTILSPKKCILNIYDFFHNGNKIGMEEFQTLPSSSINKAMGFSINGQIYLAVANPKCSDSNVYMFDPHAHRFELYQSVPLLNATDLQYFQLGFRHFLAGIGLNAAVIFEWQNEIFVPVQTFFLPLEDKELQSWHVIHTNKLGHILLLLVRSSHQLEFVTWSNLESRFIFLNDQVCLTWTRRSHPTVHIQHQITDFLREQLTKCIWDKEKCQRVIGTHTVDSVTYTLDEEQYILPMSNQETWSKELRKGLQCYTASDFLAKKSIISANEELFTRLILPLQKCIKPLIMEIEEHQTRGTTFANLQDHLEKYEKELEVYMNQLSKVKNTIIPSGVVSLNKEHYIRGLVEFDSKVKVSSSLAFNNFHFNEIHGQPVLKEYESIFAEINDTFQLVANRLTESIPLNSDLTNMSFNSIHIKGDLISKKSLTVETVNEIDLLDFLENSATDESIFIRGEKVFTNKVDIDNIEIEVMRISPFVLTDFWNINQPQIFEGIWYFDDLTVQHNMDLRGLINDVNLTNIVTTTKKTIHKVDEEKHFETLIVKGNIHTELINDFNVTQIAQTAITKTGRQEIAHPISFLKEVKSFGEITTSTVNRIDLQLLSADIVKRNEPVKLNGHKLINRKGVIKKTLTVTGLVNDHVFPDAFIQKNSVDIYAKKSFNQLTIFGNVTVDHFIDNIKTESIVMLHSPGVILGKNVFNATLHFTDVKLEGRLGKWTLPEIQKLNQNRSSIVVPPNTFSELTVTKLHFESINGIKLMHLWNDVVRKGDTGIVFTGSKTFTEKQNVHNIKFIQKVNNMNLEEDFLHVNSTRFVSGKKTFVESVTFKQDLFVNGFVDGINITKMIAETVTLDTVQVISGKKTFKRIILQEDFKVEGLLDNVQIPRDILLRHNVQKQIVSNKKVFVHGINVSTIILKNLIIDGSLNNHSWKEFEQNRVTLDTEQTISSHIIFVEDVIMEGRLEITGKINNFTRENIFENVVQTFGIQTIVGPKTISGNIRASKIYTKKGINNVMFPKLNERVIKVVGNDIQTPYRFDTIIVQNELKVQTIQNENVSFLLHDFVRRISENQLITGPVYFKRSINVNGNLQVQTVNNININRFLSVSKQQNISGNYYFGKVVVMKDVFIKELVNGVDFQILQKQALKTDAMEAVTMTFKDSLSAASLRILSVNNINIKQLKEDAVRKSGKAKILGKKTFQNSVIFNQHLQILETINDIYLDKLVSDIIFITGDQIISGKKDFDANLHIERNIQAENKVLLNTVLNISIPKLMKTAIYLDGDSPIRGKKRIFGTVEVKKNLILLSTINGIDINADAVSLTGKHTIDGTKIIETLHVSAHVLGERINDQLKKDLFANTLFINKGIQTMTGRKTFLTSVTFASKVDVHGTVCGMDWDKNVVTLDTEQMISGTKIMHMLEFDNVQITLVNNHDLHKMLASLQNLYENIEQYEAKYQFLGETKFSSEIIFHTQPLQLTFKDQIDDLQLLAQNYHAVISNLSSECLNHKSVMDNLRYGALQLQEFKSLQILNVDSSIGFATWQMNGDIFLITGHDHTMCGQDQFFLWNKHVHQFQPKENIVELYDMRKAIHWHTFRYKGDVYLILAEPTIDCGRVSQILKYDHAQEKFVRYCNLEYLMTQSTTLVLDNAVLIVMAMEHESRIITIDFTGSSCSILATDVFPGAKKVDVVDIKNWIVFANNEEIYIYEKLALSGFIMRSSISVPNLQDMQVVDFTAKQYLFVTKTDQLHSITQVLEIIEKDGQMQINTVKNFVTTLDRKVLTLGHFVSIRMQELYLVMLQKKTGVIVRKFNGFDMADDLRLITPNADKMHVFVIDDIPFIIVNKGDERNKAEVFLAEIEGSRIEEIMHCPI